MSKQVVCFGEIMLRLSPLAPHERLVKTNALKMSFAGAESNVAVSLAMLGQEAHFVTALPLNPLGDAAENSLREFGVRTDSIKREGNRIGTYFIEYGASLRATQVTYDRAGSAIATILPGTFDWEAVLAGKTWLHVTGITPALSDACAAECRTAMETARRLGVRVSFDPNYRRTLWSRTDARRVITGLLPFVNVLFANAGAAADVFDIDTGHPDTWDGHVQAARQAAHALARLANFDLLALTVRDHSSASLNDYAGLLYDGSQFYGSRPYRFEIIERLGGGDAFTAGVLHGLCQGWDYPQTVEFATAASALKHTIPGDLNLLTEAEIREVAAGNVTGKVKR
jgi:2-dehydro-3-deoxygluconokinase